MNIRAIAFSAGVLALLSAPVLAQETDHSAMGHSAMAAPKGDQGPSSKAFAEANARMHAGMDLEFSGDADVDFVKGMIAHHQGAVEMAQIVLKYGKDEELRTLATQIIAAQEPEIKFMQEWLAKQGK